MKTITTLFATIALSASMFAHAGESQSFAGKRISQDDLNPQTAVERVAKTASGSNDAGSIVIIGTPIELPNSIQQQPQKWQSFGVDLRHLLGSGPRQHIITDESYVSTKISSECQAMFDRNWAILKESARNELSPSDRHNLDNLTFEVVEFDLHRVQGIASYGDDVVRYSSDLCKAPEFYTIGVMSHELGHIDSFFGDDEIMKIVKHDYKYENIVFVNHVALMEVAGNRWGARIARDAHINSDKFLAVLDRVCSKGGKEFCGDAAEWREGLME